MVNGIYRIGQYRNFGLYRHHNIRFFGGGELELEIDCKARIWACVSRKSVKIC